MRMLRRTPSWSVMAQLRRRLPAHPSDPRRLERGQVLPLFALMSVVLLGGAALLTDVAWWWVNEQRMQRAADAGALAGAIYLPGNQTLAFSSAHAETAKNGFTNGVDGVVITPRRDPTAPRKLIVDVDGPVKTNFARVMSMDKVDVGVTGAASYVLPVPMGSPQNYYGVGFFQGVNPASTTPGSTDWLQPFAALSGTWNNAGAAFVDDDTYANKLPGPNGNGERQEYGSFNVAIPDGANVTGIEVRLRANDNVDGGCAIDVDVKSAVGWSGKQRASLPGPGSETTDPEILGGASDDWGESWSEAHIESGGFLVRVEAIDTGDACQRNADRVRLDLLEVKVHHAISVPETYEVRSVPDPAGGTLATQGFWGAIFTSGGVRENGDRYAPLYIGKNNPPDGSNGGPNPDYEANGYEYTVEVGTSGEVRLFDPVFCATGRNLSGGWFGTGDHWTTDGTGGGTTIAPVAVEFKLYDTKGTPYTTTDDAKVGSTLTYDPGSATLGDLSGLYHRAASPPQNDGRGDAQDCADHPAHNKWVLPSGWNNLSAGTYRLNVNTNLGQNANHGAENLFSIWVTGNGRARVYGGGRMAAYTNLDDTGTGGAQRFYFSQIEDVHAGKKMVITLFDPGEASSPSYLRFLSPEGNTYDYATFDWYSNDGRSGSGVTEVQTSTGSPLFNNRILTIEVGLPQDYGTGGLDPNGIGEEGWWLVEYDVRAGNDTTTWEVEIRGNPVHLVLE